MRGEHWAGHRERLRHRDLDRLGLRVRLKIVVKPLEGLHEDPAQFRTVAHVETDKILAERDFVAEGGRQQVGVGVAADIAQHGQMIGIAPILFRNARKLGDPHCK